MTGATHLHCSCIEGALMLLSTTQSETFSPAESTSLVTRTGSMLLAAATFCPGLAEHCHAAEAGRESAVRVSGSELPGIDVSSAQEFSAIGLGVGLASLGGIAVAAAAGGLLLRRQIGMRNTAEEEIKILVRLTEVELRSLSNHEKVLEETAGGNPDRFTGLTRERFAELSNTINTLREQGARNGETLHSLAENVSDASLREIGSRCRQALERLGTEEDSASPRGIFYQMRECMYPLRLGVEELRYSFMFADEKTEAINAGINQSLAFALGTDVDTEGALQTAELRNRFTRLGEIDRAGDPLSYWRALISIEQEVKSLSGESRHGVRGTTPEDSSSRGPLFGGDISTSTWMNFCVD